jgi:hypothetical protein
MVEIVAERSGVALFRQVSPQRDDATETALLLIRVLHLEM